MTKRILFYFMCFFIQTLAEKCTTPDKKEGQCVPLLSCPEVMDAFANARKASEKYLCQFICENSKEVKVCCNGSSDFKKPGDKNSILDNIQSEPSQLDLKEMFQCGPEDFPRENNSSLQLAEIRVINSGSNREYTKCLGILINTRYVLTAAECLVPNCEKNKFTIVAVRFKVIVNNEQSFKYYGIEEEVPHPFYNIVDGLNNIGLIRIHRTILKGDNIQPSCIRSRSLAIIPGPGDMSISSGKVHTCTSYDWKTISTRLIANDDCKQLLKANNKEETLTLYDLCTTDIVANTTEVTCSNYPGTPIFFPFLNPWVGGISSSRTLCGTDLPNAYTDVNVYYQWILENMKPWPINNERCETVKGETGNYVPLRYCPSLMHVFANPENGTEEHLRKYIYEKENFVICCNLSSNKETFNDIKNITIPKEFERLKQYCGFQHRDDYPQFSDNITINEFPWIAYIAIRIPGEYEPDHPQCIGSLINNRYVLTGALCIQFFESINIVRLGEFSTQNATDCVDDTTSDNKECADFEDYGIQEKIIHPFYIYSAYANNIALLRLNKSVSYSDYVRPICLPLPGTKTAEPGDLLYISGFGYAPQGIFPDFKKKIPTSLISNDQCRRELLNGHTTVTYVHPLILCTKDFANNTEFACDYDQGGPLMTHRNFQWHIEGVLATVPRCGGKEPLTYIKVSRYLKWIISNIRM